MKKQYTIPAVAAAFFTSAISITSFGLASFAVNGRRQTIAEALQWQKEHSSIEWFNKKESETYSVTSYDGYTLQAMIIRPHQASDKYVILSHGYTDNRYGNLKYMKIYLDAGFNCISYDLRGHGTNKRTYCTYSIREAKDLQVMIRDTRSRYGSGITLGLHGESLGAATTIAVLQYEQNLAFAVADCGFADILNVLKVGLRGMHLPQWLVYPASLAAKIRYGLAFTEMRPVDALAANKVPILFMHGAKDDFIVPDNSRRMQAATKGFSRLHLIPDAGHAQSVLVNPELYRTCVFSFLTELGLISSDKKESM